MTKTKKDNKNTFYIVAAVLVVILVVILMMRKPVVEEEAPEVVEPEEVVEEAPVIAPSEAPEVTEEGTIQYGTRGILSDVTCADGKITAIISNVQDESMTVKPKSYDSDLIIQVNGMRIQDFTCDKEEIGAGEYTYCEDMMGVLSVKIRDKNEVAVWFKSDDANRGVETVECTA